ncbi:F0F1 ATP synthase subunit B' [Microcoleus sp. herbarium19]|uniref:F0F1 ATP synthase subunit B' n=1 Tax=unclassified Microcoleus TaxID=2642155 RepID=UPI002FD4968A
MMHWTVLLAVEETAKEGGLFDLDATLPLMAVQFLILVAVLNVIFYKPLSKSIDDRADYIRTTQISAGERLAKAQQMAQQYEQKLGETRKQSQSVIAAAQADAQKIASAKVAEAQKEAQVAREKAGQEIEQQKQEAMRSLEQQVDSLSRQILEKLLGPSLVK